MKIIITTLCFCIIPAAFASTAPCVAGTYASYEALSGGCSVGDAVFSNFSTLAFVNSGVATLSTDQIMITPSGTATDASLTFVYLDPNGSVTPVTVNQLGQIFSFGFNFDITVTPGTLSGVEMDSTFGNTSPGSAAATKTAQLLSGGPIYTSTVNDGGISNSLGTYTGPNTPVTGSGTFVITDTTSLQAQTGMVIQSGFENSFTLAPDTSETPELGSLILIGSGLVFLGLFGRSRLNRKPRDEEEQPSSESRSPSAVVCH